MRLNSASILSFLYILCVASHNFFKWIKQHLKKSSICHLLRYSSATIIGLIVRALVKNINFFLLSLSK